MNETDSNFEALRQLLALKKHEIPPPGYFDRFSGEVVSRIRAGESARPETMLERLFAEAPWLLKLIQAFESKPAFTGVFASALCLLIVAGIVYSDNPAATPDTTAAQMSLNGSPMAAMSTGFLDASAASPQGGMIISTNPVESLDPNAAPFGRPNPLLQPVSFTH